MNPHYQKGSEFYMQRHYSEALEEYKKGLELDPNNEDAYQQIGHCYAALRQEKEAQQAFKKAVELKKFNMQDFYKCLQYGTTLFNERRYQEAIQQHKKCLTINPQYWQSYCQIGHCYAALKQEQEAIEAFEKAIELNKNDYMTYSQYANGLCTLGYYQKALEQYKTYLEVNPRDGCHHLAHRQMAHCYIALKQEQEAIEAFKKAIELYKDFTLYSEYGDLLYTLGNYQDAFEQYKQCLELNSGWSHACSQMVKCSMALEQKKYNSLHSITESESLINKKPEMENPTIMKTTLELENENNKSKNEVDNLVQQEVIEQSSHKTIYEEVQTKLRHYKDFKDCLNPGQVDILMLEKALLRSEITKEMIAPLSMIHLPPLKEEYSSILKDKGVVMSLSDLNTIVTDAITRKAKHDLKRLKIGIELFLQVLKKEKKLPSKNVQKEFNDQTIELLCAETKKILKDKTSSLLDKKLKEKIEEHVKKIKSQDCENWFSSILEKKPQTDLDIDLDRIIIKNILIHQFFEVDANNRFSNAQNKLVNLIKQNVSKTLFEHVKAEAPELLTTQLIKKLEMKFINKELPKKLENLLANAMPEIGDLNDNMREAVPKVFQSWLRNNIPSEESHLFDTFIEEELKHLLGENIALGNLGLGAGHTIVLQNAIQLLLKQFRTHEAPLLMNEDILNRKILATEINNIFKIFCDQSDATERQIKIVMTSLLNEWQSVELNKTWNLSSEESNIFFDFIMTDWQKKLKSINDILAIFKNQQNQLQEELIENENFREKSNLYKIINSKKSTLNLSGYRFEFIKKNEELSIKFSGNINNEIRGNLSNLQKQLQKDIEGIGAYDITESDKGDILTIKADNNVLKSIADILQEAGGKNIHPHLITLFFARQNEKEEVMTTEEELSAICSVQ